jgi:mRNA-degrading endonuclease RelE of RelBE toxin-antitoxin system
MENIEEIVKKLPPDLKREVEDFVNFLIEKKARKHGRKLRQDWAGAEKRIRVLMVFFVIIPLDRAMRRYLCLYL